ncbi:MAG: lipopolysaccharide biosynthesis protein [Muribaculaceae bacterium]|nr:lipopolysaccharide biosynthesis protein [Muribaculaceae bacterium]
MSDTSDLKLRTARTIKWNVIDRISSQVLYAVTGIVLARVLSQEDFGLVGATLVFQAFAALFVDSGFSYALIQRKNPTQLDYSTVLWFNIGIATLLYVILWFCAPLIAWCFQNDPRIIPLSRVMFLSFIINATAIVQTNRLMKKMDVKMIAISNTIGLIISGVVGITLALTGYGAWAIVWQTITLATIKSLILWFTSHWLPSLKFSWTALKSFFSVGSGMMITSFLNTLFQNIYSFFIGNRVGLVSLGYYTQSDKWSKMGIMSISQILTSSFLPVLSQVQDDAERFSRTTAKMNRFTAYILFPAIGFLIVMSTPIFHLLFGAKWDPSIMLFQLLLLRGIFTVLNSLYNNYIISLGKARLVVYMEVVRDCASLMALFATIPFVAMTTIDDPVYGVKILLWGQVIASAISWVVTLFVTAPLSHRSRMNFIIDLVPYVVQVALIMIPMWALSLVIENVVLLLIAQIAVGGALYFTINYLLRSQIQKDAIDYFMYRFRKGEKK